MPRSEQIDADSKQAWGVNIGVEALNNFHPVLGLVGLALAVNGSNQERNLQKTGQLTASQVKDMAVARFNQRFSTGR